MVLMGKVEVVIKTTTQSALPNRINRTDLVTNIKFVSNSTDIEITRI